MFAPIEPGGIPLINELDCPYIEQSDRYEVVPSTFILGSVSLIHTCGSSCTFTYNQKTTIEREEVAVKHFRTVKHDYSNNIYFINLYCMNYYSTITT